MADPLDPQIMLQLQDDVLRKIAELITPWSYHSIQPVFPKISFENNTQQAILVRVGGSMEAKELNIEFIPRVPQNIDREGNPTADDVIVVHAGRKFTLGE